MSVFIPSSLSSEQKTANMAIFNILTIMFIMSKCHITSRRKYDVSVINYFKIKWNSPAGQSNWTRLLKQVLISGNVFISFHNHYNNVMCPPNPSTPPPPPFWGWCTCGWFILRQFDALIIQMRWQSAPGSAPGRGRGAQFWPAAGLLSSRLVWPLTSPLPTPNTPTNSVPPTFCLPFPVTVLRWRLV